MSGRVDRKRARRGSEKPDAGDANKLAAFLDHPNRPAETLSYYGLQGFLFAVASGPQLVMPSDWVPEIFAGEDPGFESPDEAEAILPELISLYNAVNATVLSERATLLPDCRFRRNVLANLDDDAPVSLWSRGFLRGHQWLEEDWKPCVPDEFDRDFATLLMTLSFFASRRLAEAYVHEFGDDDLQEAAKVFRLAFPDAVAEYARLGRSIHKVLLERGVTSEPLVMTKVGRNDPCPCGSGRKYKKCCGAGPAH